jgi:hypothetical protein
MNRIKTGAVVTLTPKSEYAKEKTGYQENKWIVEAISERILFNEKSGVWLGLRLNSKNSLDFTWVHLTDDEHFNVIF